MLKIKYKIQNRVNIGTDESPVWHEDFVYKAIPYNESNEEIAKRESHNGVYEIYDDGQPDPADTPSQLDVIEAQVTYTALMTDTLLEV